MAGDELTAVQASWAALGTDDPSEDRQGRNRRSTHVQLAFVYWREDDESGRSGVLLVEATGRQVGSYSWVPARISQGIPVPQGGDAAAADITEWESRRACSGLSP
jgi:hypothetical protein